MTDHIDPLPAHTRGPSLTLFRWGLLAGAIIPLLAAGAVAATGRLWAPSPPFNVQVLSVGADVTRNGGVQIGVAGGGRGLVQRCIGACDDLELRLHVRAPSHHIQVLDAHGRCVACSDDIYVDDGYGATATRSRISGADKLSIQPAS